MVKIFASLCEVAGTSGILNVYKEEASGSVLEYTIDGGTRFYAALTTREEEEEYISFLSLKLELLRVRIHFCSESEKYLCYMRLLASFLSPVRAGFLW